MSGEVHRGLRASAPRAPREAVDEAAGPWPRGPTRTRWACRRGPGRRPACSPRRRPDGADGEHLVGQRPIDAGRSASTSASATAWLRPKMTPLTASFMAAPLPRAPMWKMRAASASSDRPGALQVLRVAAHHERQLAALREAHAARDGRVQDAGATCPGLGREARIVAGATVLGRPAPRPDGLPRAARRAPRTASSTARSSASIVSATSTVAATSAGVAAHGRAPARRPVPPPGPASGCRASGRRACRRAPAPAPSPSPCGPCPAGRRASSGISRGSRRTVPATGTG